MVDKARVYTRRGDGGTSQLLSVGRVPKNHPRLMLYGEIDELNSLIGASLAQQPVAPLAEQLDAIQDRLFVLGSQIAVPNPDAIGMPIPSIADEDTEQLETWIDALDDELPPLKNFILPGGSPAAAQLHVARAVCRRCERDVLALDADDPLEDAGRRYLNRLSDYLFTAARYDNHKHNIGETDWDSGR